MDFDIIYQGLLDQVKRTGKVHSVKTWPEYYDDVCAGNKRFEVRQNDRNYQVGDHMELRKFIPDQGYTGHRKLVKITSILHGGQFGIEPGYVVLSISLNY